MPGQPTGRVRAIVFASCFAVAAAISSVLAGPTGSPERAERPASRSAPSAAAGNPLHDFAAPFETEREASGAGAIIHASSGRHAGGEAFPGQAPRFVQRTVTERGALEPPLAFSTKGSLFYPSWAYSDPDLGLQATALFRSDDHGRTWHQNDPQIGGVPFNIEGGDPILYRDHVTGRLFYLLYLHSCAHLAWTDDNGETWGRPLEPRICEPAGVTDYPKLWTSKPVGADTTEAGAPFYIHLCYNALYRLACQRSIDGGLTFLPSPSPDPESATNYHLNGCWSFHANWTVAAKDGTIYMPRPYCDNLEVAISRDNGLSWERKVVARYPTAQNTDFGGDTRLAMDQSGNLYYLWISRSWYIGDGASPFLSVSRDGGETWSKPFDVGVPGLTASKHPFIVAGDDGRIAFSYLGSKVPGGFAAPPETMASARWDAYISVSLNALSADPVFATTTGNPADNPLRRGPCDGRCTPNPDECIYDCNIGSASVGMFDYLELALDPVSGRLAMSLVDLCAAKCGTATGTSADPPSFVGAVAVQDGGSLLIQPPGPAAPPQAVVSQPAAPPNNSAPPGRSTAPSVNRPPSSSVGPRTTSNDLPPPTPKLREEDPVALPGPGSAEKTGAVHSTFPLALLATALWLLAAGATAREVRSGPRAA